MKEQNRPPEEIDDSEDRMGSVRELDFEKERQRGRIGDERPAQEVNDQFPPERAAEIGMSGGETLVDSAYEDHVDSDDLARETLIDEGTESELDPSDDTPADRELRIVGESEIGGGIGLDEAELGRSAPLDGEPWTDRVSPADDAEDDSR